MDRLPRLPSPRLRRAFARALLAALLLFPLSAALADSVELRNGQVLRGTIVGQTRQVVRIRTVDGVQTVSKTEIRRIAFGDVEEPQPEPVEKPEPAEPVEKTPEENPQQLEPVANAERPDVWDALWRSALIPGWGQWTQGRTTAAWTYGGGALLLAGASVALAAEAESANSAYETEATVLFLSGLPAAGGPGGALQNRDAAFARAERSARNARAAAGLLAGLYLWNLADVVIFQPAPGMDAAFYSREDGAGLQLRLRF